MNNERDIRRLKSMLRGLDKCIEKNGLSKNIELLQKKILMKIQLLLSGEKVSIENSEILNYK